MAFPEVKSLNANLSEERIFSGVFEHGLFINQPEEVRVVYEGFKFFIGKVSGGVKSFF